MIKRCRVGIRTSVPWYTGRVRVVVEWFSFEAFRKWALANGYADHLSIDRINTDGDYRPANCRWASQSQQNANRRKKNGMSSRFKGVCWDEVNGKWVAQITSRYRNYKLGRFADEREAAKAYDRAARELWGEYARTNFRE
jgi:hypothetical protein